MKKKTQKRMAGRAPRHRRAFSRKDYSNDSGMMTNIWGPATWHLLHTMSFNYPVKPTLLQKRQYRQFILQLRHVLPCGKCRDNLSRNLAVLPLEWSHMKSRATFSMYVFRLHELVNAMLGKTSRLSYLDVRDRYEHFRARCSSPHSHAADAAQHHHEQVEDGCVEPLKGRKTKCVLSILPLEHRGQHDFHLCSKVV